MMTIHTNGYISLDGQFTGLAVTQGKCGTEVYTPERARYDSTTGAYIGQYAYKLHPMPRKRYALSTDEGSDKAPGRKQFEADIRALLAAVV